MRSVAVSTVFCLVLGTIVFAEEASHEFSNPPSNLPVKKIFVHGVAQQQFAGGYANNPPPPVAPQGYESPVPGYAQQPAPAPQPYDAPPPPPATAPPAPAPTQPSFQNLPVNEEGQSGNLGEGFQTGKLPDEETPAPAPPPTEAPAPPPPPPTEAPAAPKYPLPECYTNKSGFMCCNSGLESTINDAYDQLKKSRDGKWSTCNIQDIANRVQKMAEERFNTTFEALAGVSDYASKSHFYHNYICKVERDNRYILAYASPRKDRLPQDEGVQGDGQTGENPQPAPYKAAHHHTFVWRK